MGEKLKLIQVLREEVSELIKDRDITKKEYDDVENLFDKTFYSMQDGSKELENLQLCFKNAKDTKILKFIGPLSTTVATITFFLLKFLTSCQLSDILLVEGLILTFTSVIPICLASTIFDNIIEKYLVKKYPNIEKMYDKVNSLTNDISLKEQQFMEMRRKKEVLTSNLKITEDKLSRKKEELYYLEEDYFNNLVGKEINMEDSRETTIGSAGRGKRRVRIPEFNENLGN